MLANANMDEPIVIDMIKSVGVVSPVNETRVKENFLLAA